jgi:hypothetical protein
VIIRHYGRITWTENKQTSVKLHGDKYLVAGSRPEPIFFGTVRRERACQLDTVVRACKGKANLRYRGTVGTYGTYRRYGTVVPLSRPKLDLQRVGDIAR